MVRDWIRGYNLACRAEFSDNIEAAFAAASVASDEFNRGVNQRCREISIINSWPKDKEYQDGTDRR